MDISWGTVCELIIGMIIAGGILLVIQAMFGQHLQAVGKTFIGG